MMIKALLYNQDLNNCTSLLGLVNNDLNYEELGKFENILLNLRHPGWVSSLKIVEALLTQIKQTSKFQLKF